MHSFPSCSIRFRPGLFLLCREIVCERTQTQTVCTGEHIVSHHAAFDNLADACSRIALQAPFNLVGLKFSNKRKFSILKQTSGVLKPVCA